MTLNAPSAVDAIVWPGNVPGIRKLLVKLALMRAGTASDMQKEVDASTLADDLDIPPSLTGLGRFVRLSAIADVAKGPTGIKDARPGPYPLVVTAEDRGSCDHYDFEGEAVLIPTVSSTGHGDASLKRIHYQEGRFAVGSILAAVRVRDRALNSTRFLYEYLSVFKDELLVARMSGTANVSLTVKKIEGVPIPLIRIAQQQHVHDLLRLCDALEDKGRLEAEQHARLLRTLLGTLPDSSTPEELAANWQRVADQFDLLLDRPEAVDALEQTILQLAVRGLLVPQDPSDEPASALLEQVRCEGNRLEAKPTSKRGLAAGELQADQGFRLPSGWEWVCLADLLPEFQNGVASRGDTGGRQITVLRLADIKARRVSLADTRQIPIAERDIQKYRLRSGDILVTRVNGSADIVGQFNLCEEDVDAIYCDHFIRLRVRHDWLDPAFAAVLGESDLIRNRIRGLFITTAGQKTVNQGHIGSLRFALPPRTEQIRIVTRVTEIRRLCAELRQRLTSGQTTQSHLAEALVGEV